MASPSAPVSPVTSARPGRRRRALAVLGLVLAFGIVASACTSGEEDHGVEVINNARRNHVQLLGTNVTLVLTAQSWSQQLAKNGKLSHRSPISAGAPAGWRKLGENVGFGSSVDVVQSAFMASTGHKANIMDPVFNNVGVGVTVDGSGRRWVVQEFAQL